ncbi:hypothetical protein J6590_065517 [Homalodisca vitripennis]|nr:hypothetical protein J6590_065517 [Homalodisca vitripennis]
MLGATNIPEQASESAVHSSILSKEIILNSHHGIDTLPYSQKICSRIHITELTVKHLASEQVSENAVSVCKPPTSKICSRIHITELTVKHLASEQVSENAKICSRIHITELTVKHLASEQVSENAVSSPILSEDMFQNSHHGIDSETSGEIHITELTVKHLASEQVSENAVSSPILSEDMFQNSHHGIDSVRKCCKLSHTLKICSRISRIDMNIWRVNRIHITELTVKHLASEQVSENAVSSPILSEDMFQNSHHGIDSETSGEIHITELTVKHLAREQVSGNAVSSPILSEDMFQNSHHGIDSETSGE